MTQLHEPITIHHLQRCAEALEIAPIHLVRRPTHVLHVGCSSKLEALQAAIEAVSPNPPNLVATARKYGEDAARLRGGAVLSVLLSRLLKTPVRELTARKVKDVQAKA